MTERPPDSDVEMDAERPLHALVDLHALAGTLGAIDPGGVPGFRSTSPATALRAVAEAPEDEIPASARLAILHDLARADFPDYETHAAEYRLLAASVAEGRDLDVDGLLDDIKASAGEDFPFGATTSGRRFPHHLVAFVGEDVCTTRTVEVEEGLTATWIFSEFETDAPFDHVVEWIDPRNWPNRDRCCSSGWRWLGAGDRPRSHLSATTIGTGCSMKRFRSCDDSTPSSIATTGGTGAGQLA